MQVCLSKLSLLQQAGRDYVAQIVLSEPAFLSALPALGKKYLPKGNDFVILVKRCFFRELEKEANLAYNYCCK